MWSTKLWRRKGRGGPLTQNHWNGEDFSFAGGHAVGMAPIQSSLEGFGNYYFTGVNIMCTEEYCHCWKMTGHFFLCGENVQQRLCSSDAMPAWGRVKMGPDRKQRWSPTFAPSWSHFHRLLLTPVLSTWKDISVLFFGIWYSCKSYTSI